MCLQHEEDDFQAQTLEMLSHELLVHHTLGSHPHIVSLLARVVAPAAANHTSGHPFGYAMERLSGGDLYDMLS